MSDYTLPELPSDDELGIAGLSEEDFLDDPPESPPVDPPPGDVPPPPAEPPPPVATGKPTASRPSGPTGPGWRGPLTLLILVLAAWASRPHHTMPAPAAANAPDSVFSSARAMTQLVEITREPHPTGSPAHTEVRERLVDHLEAMGLAPEIQTTTYLREGAESATGATVRNIMARIPGAQSSGAIVLTAHYDSRTFSHGAGDDATGVATILETVRALQSDAPLDNDLIVLITDAEELGLIGARAFVDRHPWMDDVRLVISVEMRGGGGPSIMFETKDENGWVIERLAEADPHPLANSVSVDIYRRMPRDTDYTPFRLRGVQGLNFAAIGRAHVYHQTYDTSENLDEATLQHHGVRVLALVRDLGRRDLDVVDGPDRAFVTLPFVGLVTHPLSLTLPLTAGLALLLVITVLIAKVRGGDLRSLAAGAALGLLATGLTAGLGRGMLMWATGRHPEFGSLMGSAFHVEGWYVVALAAAAAAIATLCLRIFAGRLHRPSVLLGAVLPVSLLAVALGFVAPDAAPNLQGPAAAALASVLGLAMIGEKRASGWAAWGLTLLLALPVLGFLVTIIELVWLAMSFTLAVGIGAALALTMLLIAPALDGLRTPNGWWAPATFAVVAMGAALMGALTASSTAARPAPSTLIYIQDQGGPGAPVRGLWASRADAGLAWAREATGTPLEDPEEFPELQLGFGGWLVSDAPAVTLAPPRALVVADSLVDGLRLLTLAVDPGTDAETVRFAVSPPAVLSRIGDADLTSAGNRIARVLHHGRPQDSVFALQVLQDPGLTTLDLEILQHHQRPWDLVPGDVWTRPPELAPNVMNQSDRAVIRSSVRLLLDGAASAADSAGVEPSANEQVGAPTAVTGSTEGGTPALVVPDSGGVTPPDSGGVTPPDTTTSAAPDTTAATTPSGTSWAP